MTKHPIIFGEVLFDQFPDGTEVLGGAPFNVAWHLQGFGVEPLFITAIGEDPAGDKVLAAMQSWGMNTAGVQRQRQHPTGKVRIELEQGQPTFTILDQQAYDFIDCDEQLLQKNRDTALLYHGSLAARHSHSSTSLSRIADRVNAPLFIDINLRPPWWTHENITQLASRARWMKLNEHELAELHHCDSLPRTQWTARSREILEKFQLELVILTKGEDGASFISRDHQLDGKPVPVDKLVDTVGAGDAFSAVTILGLLQKWSHEDTLARALAFASRICAQRGATAINPDLYKSCMDSW